MPRTYTNSPWFLTGLLMVVLVMSGIQGWKVFQGVSSSQAETAVDALQ